MSFVPPRVNLQCPEMTTSNYVAGDTQRIKSAPPYATLNRDIHFKAKDVGSVERMRHLGPLAQKCHQSWMNCQFSH